MSTQSVVVLPYWNIHASINFYTHAFDIQVGCSYFTILSQIIYKLLCGSVRFKYNLLYPHFIVWHHQMELEL